MSLLTRIFLINVSIFAIAGLVLALTPATVSTQIAAREAAVLVLALAAILIANFLLLRRTFAPLHRLSEQMDRVEILQPSRPIPVIPGDRDVARLSVAFNGMLARLENERRDSVRRSLAAQEDERRRVAQELHDEVGQSLTALLLQMDRVARGVPADVRDEVDLAREAVRSTLDEVREVARRLRPEALDDLGLATALAALCQRVGEHGGLVVRRSIDEGLPSLTPEGELVVYRVTQEALTNVLRHAQASRADLTLRYGGGTVTLTIEDDGRGLAGSVEGAGMQGMRERALLLDGDLRIDERPAGGTAVRLAIDVPGAGA